MRFDWRRFCERYRIEYVTAGPNTASGNISIRCPFCGNADPSQHMGLSLRVESPYWGCLRNHEHRGRSPVKLVAHLLQISFRDADALVVTEAPPVEDFDAALNNLRLLGEKMIPDKQETKIFLLPPECRPLGSGGVYETHFLDYLESRGLVPPHKVAEAYDLHYALTGDQAWRLIFPIRNYEDGTLYGWTGRDIRGAALRYRTAPGMGKGVVLSFPRRKTDRVLVICEGPIDAMKLDWYGRPFGVAAVAVMGRAPTAGQVQALNHLVENMSVSWWVMFDSDAYPQGLAFAEELGAYFKRIPDGYKDIGEMPPGEIAKLCRGLVGE